jgi:hypothetical protein
MAKGESAEAVLMPATDPINSEPTAAATVFCLIGLFIFVIPLRIFEYHATTFAVTLFSNLRNANENAFQSFLDRFDGGSQ